MMMVDYDGDSKDCDYDTLLIMVSKRMTGFAEDESLFVMMENTS